MKQSFDKITNSWLYRIGEAIGNVVIISGLFLLFCLPVVTIGASASALYYTVYRKYHKKCDSITSDFMRSLRQNLKSGIIINVISIVFIGLAALCLYYASNGIGGVKLPDWYSVVAFVPLLPVILTLPYAYALLARFNNNVKGTLTNSYTLCMITFPKFILIWLIVLAAIAICIVFPPAALVVPVGAAYLLQMIIEKVFEKAISVEENRSKKDEVDPGDDDGSDPEEESDDNEETEDD